MAGTDIGEAIRGLADLPREQLIEQFKSLYALPAPKGIRDGLLRQAIAYRLQVNAMEGRQGKQHPHAVLMRRLDKLATELRQTGKVSVVAAPPTVKAGTRLVRQWQGETHSVTVTSEGFEYRGETHRSLSEIARLITGTRWSGPVFFGLRENGHGRT